MCARPTAVGFAADSAEYIIFRFWNLIEIARRVRGDELIYSRARPHQSVFSGMNCISLRNVCQLLCVELRQLYQKQIEILRDAEDYEEVCIYVEYFVVTLISLEIILVTQIILATKNMINVKGFSC